MTIFGYETDSAIDAAIDRYLVANPYALSTVTAPTAVTVILKPEKRKEDIEADSVKVDTCRKKKIVVVGLKGGNMTIVKNVVKEKARLSFIDVDHSIQQMRNTCKSADCVFLMRNFVSHRHSEAVRSTKVKTMTYVNGGIDDLVSKIKEMI